MFCKDRTDPGFWAKAPRCMCSRSTILLELVPLLLLLSACVVEKATTSEVASVAAGGGPVTLRVQPCLDRTHFSGRDLGGETTTAITEQLGRTVEFRIDPSGPYVLSCEVSNFLEGSALKRWLVPGWGPTVAQVAVILTDGRNGSTVLIVRGNGTVRSGGLYSIGADLYIVDAAVGDVVRQMRDWARARPRPADSAHRLPVPEVSGVVAELP